MSVINSMDPDQKPSDLDLFPFQRRMPVYNFEKNMHIVFRLLVLTYYVKS